MASVPSFPSYFCPMLLCDTARADAYRRAISAAIEDFRRLNGRAPVVLDLGCGTGLLGYLAAVAGADTIVSVDHNEACLAATREVSRLLPEVAWRVVHASEFDEHEDRVDMLVCELLGTLAFCEGAHDIIDEYLPCLRSDVVGGPYIVPQAVTQTVCTARIDERLPWLAQSARDLLLREACFVGTNSCNLHPAFTLAHVGAWQVVYDLDCSKAPPVARELEAVFSLEESDLLLCEWTARLWGDVRLVNSVDGYRELDVRTAIGRENAWGFAVAAAPRAEASVRVFVAREVEGGDLVLHAEAVRLDGPRWHICGLGAASPADSLGALLCESSQAEVEAAVDAAAAAGGDVLVETGENVCVVAHVEHACLARELDDPWHQSDVHATWSMRHVEHDLEVEEPAQGEVGVTVALCADLDGERVSELACRHNDERFAKTPSTPALVRTLLGGFGGGAARIVKLPPPSAENELEREAPEWSSAVLHVGDVALCHMQRQVLRAFAGYAFLTRHGMDDDEDSEAGGRMPGAMMQSLPLYLGAAADDPLARGIQIGLSVADTTPPDLHAAGRSKLATLLSVDGEKARRLVSHLCVGGAAVALRE